MPDLAGFRRGADADICARSRNITRGCSRTRRSWLSTRGSLVFTGVVDDPETLATLRRLGFQRPGAGDRDDSRLAFRPPRRASQSPRAREVLTELTPGLLEAFAGSGDPDAALAAFDAALARMPAAVELMSILRSNAALRELFGDLFGGAPGSRRSSSCARMRSTPSSIPARAARSPTRLTTSAKPRASTPSSRRRETSRTR